MTSPAWLIQEGARAGGAGVGDQQTDIKICCCGNEVCCAAGGRYL
jgi:hypothetical protein